MRPGLGSEGFLGYAYAEAGRDSEAQLIAAQHRDLPWVQALVYVGRGEKDKAIEGLWTMAATKHPRSGIYACSLNSPRCGEIRG